MSNNTGRFSKGFIPWNKGKRGVQAGWNKGLKLGPAWNKGLPSPFKGFKRPKEVGEKISAVLKGHKVSEETRKKLSISKKGQRVSSITEFKKGTPPWNKDKKYTQISGRKHWMWKGGITKINHRLRTSLEYKLWRNSVLERDKFMCIWCGNDELKELEADHIKPFSLFPELRFAIDNGRTLCKTCHRKTGLQKRNQDYYKNIIK